MPNKKRQWKTGQLFHAKTGRPFRGPTLPNVFQTIDIGSGKAEWLSKRSKERRNGKKGLPRKRAYAGVDEMYDSEAEGNKRYVMLPEEYAPFERDHPNILLIPQTAKEFLIRMIKRREKTRHINMDMPWPIENATGKDAMDMQMILRLARAVVIPNGKIFIASENPKTIEIIVQMARAMRYRARIVSPLKRHQHQRLTSTMLRWIVRKQVQNQALSPEERKISPSPAIQRAVITIPPIKPHKPPKPAKARTWEN